MSKSKGNVVTPFACSNSKGRTARDIGRPKEVRPASIRSSTSARDESRAAAAIKLFEASKFIRRTSTTACGNR